MINPYSFDINKEIKFNFKYLNNSDIKIVCNDKNSDKNIKNKIIKDFKLLKICDLYNNHKDIALELIQKREIYNDSYIDDLLKNYEGKIFKNREDLLRLITCGYVTDEDLGKRPLSKLIKDISEQLDLI